MKELGLADTGGYRTLLETGDEEWKALDGMCRITISRFCRDREVFRVLQDQLLPALANSAEERRRDVLRCWSAGCGSGEEPYSLSLLWRMPGVTGPAPAPINEYPGISLLVEATDADSMLLRRAAEAVYPRGALKELPKPWVSEAFEEVESGLALLPPLRRDVRFQTMDIREELPESAFDLVLCRNLAFTYFEESLQAEVLGGILDRLEPGGYLVLGSHESLPPGSWPLAQIRPGLPVFLRSPGASRPHRTP
jgi:chemotaxis protein methyltransferase CheR